MEQTEHKARLIDGAGITGFGGGKRNIFSIKRSACLTGKAIVQDLRHECLVEKGVVSVSGEWGSDPVKFQNLTSHSAHLYGQTKNAPRTPSWDRIRPAICCWPEVYSIQSFICMPSNGSLSVHM